MNVGIVGIGTVAAQFLSWENCFEFSVLYLCNAGSVVKTTLSQSTVDRAHLGKNLCRYNSFTARSTYFLRNILYSALFHPPPLRFYWVGGCCDRTHDCYVCKIKKYVLWWNWWNWWNWSLVFYNFLYCGYIVQLYIYDLWSEQCVAHQSWSHISAMTYCTYQFLLHTPLNDMVHYMLIVL
jgi:hypothetical protein